VEGELMQPRRGKIIIDYDDFVPTEFKFFAIENHICELFYLLYAITEEEIKIIEGK
jgi:hypothetical protein